MLAVAIRNLNTRGIALNYHKSVKNNSVNEINIKAKHVILWINQQ